MNGRLSKKMRRVLRKNDLKVALEFKQWVNSLPLIDRLMIGWKAIWKVM